MSRQTVTVFVVACLLGGWPAYGDWVWKPQTGWLDPNKTPRDTTPLRYKHALALVAQGEGKSAVAQLEALIKENPDAPWLEEARFNIAEAYFQATYYRKAAKAFESYLKEYPSGRRADDALKRMLNIGVTLSEKQGSLTAATDVLQKIIERGAGTGLADDASSAIGDAYYRAGHYDEAVMAYQDLQSQFPASEWVPAVPYKIGRCYLDSGESVDINPEAYAKARSSFEEYIRKYPNGVHVAEAKERIKTAQALQARSEYRLAAFYVRTRKPKSAAIYLKSVVKQFPGTQYADQARALLERLRRLDAIP